jgi:hypothetical protein
MQEVLLCWQIESFTLVQTLKDRLFKKDIFGPMKFGCTLASVEDGG